MIQKIKWFKVLFIMGIVALVIGSVDPLEGSVLILPYPIGWLLSIALLITMAFKKKEKTNSKVL